MTHTRLRPRRHHLRYRIFMLLLDLDGLEALARRIAIFSLDRFNLVALHRRDHGDGSDNPLKDQIARLLAEQTIAWDGGPIRMLVMPRILGYAFNPLTVYYCHRRDGALAATIYEVHNTFGQRHVYLVPVEGEGAPIQQACDKRFHVSPFLGMGMRYRFTLDVPGDGLKLAIAGEDRQGPVIAASFSGRRRDLTAGSLLAAVAGMPWLGLKVIGAIHWEALRLWLKGVGLHARPAPPRQAVTRGRDATARPAGHSPEAPHRAA